jgi:hypothetical protein
MVHGRSERCAWPTYVFSLRGYGFLGRCDIARLTNRNEPGGHIPSPMRGDTNEWLCRGLEGELMVHGPTTAGQKGLLPLDIYGPRGTGAIACG